MRKILLAGIIMSTVTFAIASKPDNTYALNTGEAGAARLYYQSSLMNHKSYEHVDKAGLKPGHIVYDIACGNGAMTKYLASKVSPEGRVYAIDRSQEQLDLARKRLEEAKLNNVEFIQADVTEGELPLPQMADVIYIRLLLMHLKDPAAALEKILRLLKPGGLLLIQEPVNSTNYSEGQNEVQPLVETLMALGRSRGLDYDMGLRLPELAASAGLQLVDHFDHHLVLEPDVAKPLLELSLNEWGKKALIEGLIDQDKFDQCMSVARTLNRTFHYAKAVYLIARK